MTDEVLNQQQNDGIDPQEPEKRDVNSAPTQDIMQDRVVAALKSCYDPEIPVDIYELGLIYDIAIDMDRAHVDVAMTLTSPACPVAGTLPLEVEHKVCAAEGVESAKVEVVWDPPWTPDMMTEAARLELGF